ncbi:MAG: DUF4384 domain-containing protein [Myxococcales bacterium]|nr:DUF4384 domain-containing protein [Myxococcales bacterium]
MTIKTNLEEQEPAMKNALRDYYQEHKALHQPSQKALQRLLQSIPETPAPAPPKESWWKGFAWMRWSLLPLSAVAATLLLWKTPVVTPSTTTPPRRIAKSALPSIRLLFARKTKEGFVHKRAADPQTILQEGDIVQFSYEAPQAMHLMVVSINKKGDVSLYLPFEQRKSLAIPQGKGFFPPDSSLVLDDYQGPELFLFFSAQKPFSFKRIQSMLKQAYHRAQGRLDQLVPPKTSWDVETLLLQKTTRR